MAQRLEAARQVYNACLGEALTRLRAMRERRDYARARAMDKGKARSALFHALRKTHGFSNYDIQRVGRECRGNAFTELVGGHEAQTLATRAFRAVEQYAYGKPSASAASTFGTAA